jgi:hypothetical protein
MFIAFIVTMKLRVNIPAIHKAVNNRQYHDRGAVSTAYYTPTPNS